MVYIESRTSGYASQIADGENGLILLDQPLLGLYDDTAILEVLASLLGSDWVSPSLGVANAKAGAIRPVKTVREPIQPEMGEGYWEIFYLNSYSYVITARAKYHEDRWMSIPGGRHLRVRLLLTGQIGDEHGNIVGRGPQVQFAISTTDEPSRYVIKGGQQLNMVVLCFYGSILTDLLGFEPSDIPQPFDRLLQRGGEIYSATFALSPELAERTQRIMGIHHSLPMPLRIPAIEAISRETLCIILGDFINYDRLNRGPSRMNMRDINRIYKVRDHLAENYTVPPTIRSLSRMVGVNQTKLKSGFKELFGTTVYDFIMQQRMKRAAGLLLADDCSIAEISYAVGYQHPTNFTMAFKRHFSTSPSEWRRSCRNLNVEPSISPAVPVGGALWAGLEG